MKSVGRRTDAFEVVAVVAVVDAVGVVAVDEQERVGEEQVVKEVTAGLSPTRDAREQQGFAKRGNNKWGEVLLVSGAGELASFVSGHKASSSPTSSSQSGLRFSGRWD